MKVRIVFGFFVLLSVLLGSCAKENEVPPYKTTNIESYIMPVPTPLTMEEREAVKAQRDEYNSAIKGQ
ncbi:MAG: hypothetical protein K2O69_03970 [Odoribacter sp.]|nr:hypothetical protein [Odoribacter sp.]